MQTIDTRPIHVLHWQRILFSGMKQLSTKAHPSTEHTFRVLHRSLGQNSLSTKAHSSTEHTNHVLHRSLGQNSLSTKAHPSTEHTISALRRSLGQNSLSTKAKFIQLPDTSFVCSTDYRFSGVKQSPIKANPASYHTHHSCAVPTTTPLGWNNHQRHENLQLKSRDTPLTCCTL